MPRFSSSDVQKMVNKGSVKIAAGDAKGALLVATPKQKPTPIDKPQLAGKPAGIADSSRFEIPAKFPSLNEYVNENRKSAQAGHAMKKKYDLIVMTAVLAQRPKRHHSCCMVTIEWHEEAYRRDIDNITYAAKFILDGLRKAGVLIEDNQRVVNRINNQIIVDGKYSVAVILTEIDPNTALR